MKKRILALILSLIFLFSACCGRISYIIFSGDYQVSSGYNSYNLKIDSLNSNLYDCNMKKINNNNKKLVAVIKPDEKSLSELPKLFSEKETDEILNELKYGHPVLREINNYEKCNNILIFEAYDNDKMNNSLKNLTNGLIEKIGEKSISFAVDANGRLLSGDNDVISEENYNSKKGYKLSIDENIQTLTDEAVIKSDKTAIVVMDIKTHRLLALSSSGNDNINRCITPYAVGSVFKLIVSSCAIENGINMEYFCNGEITVGDTVFSCQNKTEHKNMNMQTALEKSCNCYFIKLALELGAERLLKTASDFGFGKSYELYNEFTLDNGNMPSVDELKTKGQLALLGFGQGLINATPLAFCNAVCTIANGGLYSDPLFVLNSVDDEGYQSEIYDNSENRIISEKTASVLKGYMRSVVEYGTGKNADYNGQSAGKTSTAQSGIYENDKEILYAWFAGFYPYDSPEYAIVVMVENGTSGAGDCCPIFRSLVEKLEIM